MKADHDPYYRYIFYMKGWRAAAAGQPLRKCCIVPQAYQDGFAKGKKDAAKTSLKAAKDFGYTPTILRTEKTS